jgi:hypothetical protein
MHTTMSCTRSIVIWLLGCLAAVSGLVMRQAAAAEKPRVIVLTDIENEPDDAMSLVRFLVYANQWDTEALIATTSVHLPDRTAPDRIRTIVTAYGKVRDTLAVHEPGFPAGDELLARIVSGIPRYGLTGVGKEHDSPGSERIIEVVDAADPRPVWVCVWGGPNCLAQALWKVRASRTPEALARFVAKLRVYTISDQDDTGPWLRREFPGLFYVASPGFHPLGGYHYATWTGIAGDELHGRFAGADFSLVSQPWLDEHVRRKGPLGAEYPPVAFMMEGDTPSFLNLINTGLANPERPDFGGWGGRYEVALPPLRKWHLEREARPFWTNCMDEVLGKDGRWHTDNWATIWRWRPAFQNDFASRMDWTITPRYEDANHPPVPKLGHAREFSAKPGEQVTLDATGSSDPDGDPLTFEWMHYPEPGSFTFSSGRSARPLVIEQADQSQATLVVPEKFGRAGTCHLILAVTDGGSPPLTRYERLIVTIEPPAGPTR